MKKDLGFEMTLHQPYEQSLDSVTAALMTQGFGVLTRIDVRATMKEKLGVDFRPYTILGACNPPLAHRALECAPEVGLLLPCNVTVESIDPDNSRVRIANPSMMVDFASEPGDPSLQEVASTATQKLLQVIEVLKSL
jgi:uncharacterized protein (DUF302 family)